MAIFEVEPGAPLMGEAVIHPAKNAALPVIAASLLTADTLVVPDMPDLTDVQSMCELLVACGATVERDGASMALSRAAAYPARICRDDALDARIGADHGPDARAPGLRAPLPCRAAALSASGRLTYT